MIYNSHWTYIRLVSKTKQMLFGVSVPLLIKYTAQATQQLVVANQQQNKSKHNTNNLETTTVTSSYT